MVEWDRDKAASNLEKHGVDFADAATILEDEMALTQADEGHANEERWLTLGMDALGRILVVSYTWRGDEHRLISARIASKRERKQYEAKR